jgi:hypothetical protein
MKNPNKNYNITLSGNNNFSNNANKLFNRNLVKNNHSNFMKLKPPVNRGNSSSREITLYVPQGLGDIFWIYQKFSLHFDKINFTILATSEGKVSSRAIDWIKLFPKCGEIKMKKVSQATYNSNINGLHKMQSIISVYQMGQGQYFHYSCNKHLEDGKRIETIDPEYSYEETVAIETSKVELPFDKYLVIYVSGNAMKEDNNWWNISKWEQFFVKLNKEVTNLPVVIIGASYDQSSVHSLEKVFKENKVPYCSLVDKMPSQVCYVLKNSQGFIGYQSGLNIMADNFDVNQFMLYFPALEKMMYTWCKSKNANTKYFAKTFNSSIDECINLISDNNIFINKI